MNVEVLGSQLLIVSLGLFFARWIINWTLLNAINGTTFSMFRANYSISEVPKLFKHVAISEWKFWWFDLKDHRVMKIISNLLSSILYLSILVLILLIIVV